MSYMILSLKMNRSEGCSILNLPIILYYFNRLLRDTLNTLCDDQIIKLRFSAMLVLEWRFVISGITRNLELFEANKSHEITFRPSNICIHTYIHGTKRIIQCSKSYGDCGFRCTVIYSK